MTLAGIGIGTLGLTAYRVVRDRRTRRIKARLFGGGFHEGTSCPRFSADPLAGLPAPARRYLRHAIAIGTPLADACRLTLRGSMCPAPGQPRLSLTATEVLAPRDGFVWTAQSRMCRAACTGCPSACGITMRQKPGAWSPIARPSADAHRKRCRRHALLARSTRGGSRVVPDGPRARKRDLDVRRSRLRSLHAVGRRRADHRYVRGRKRPVSTDMTPRPNTRCRLPITVALTPKIRSTIHNSPFTIHNPLSSPPSSSGCRRGSSRAGRTRSRSVHEATGPVGMRRARCRSTRERRSETGCRSRYSS